jgi:hypothetical protein
MAAQQLRLCPLKASGGGPADHIVESGPFGSQAKTPFEKPF